VSVDGLFDIGHATVAYFNSVAVEYFVQGVACREFIIDDIQKCLSNIR
jgi:hypothetical protein